MAERIREHLAGMWEELRNPAYLRQWAWVFVLGGIMLIILYINIQFLRENYADAPIVPDLLLDIIPENPDAIPAGEIFSSMQLALTLFLFASSRERFRKMPYLFFMLGIMYILRGYAIILTPLGQIQPPSENYTEGHFIAQNFYHGMYFSGHSASAMIQVMFFHQFRWRKIRLSWLILPLAVGQMAALIISHQHYSIDIFGAFFVAYFMTHFDFMKLVPRAWHHARWAPWFVPAAPVPELRAVSAGGMAESLPTPQIYSNGHNAEEEKTLSPTGNPED